MALTGRWQSICAPAEGGAVHEHGRQSARTAYRNGEAAILGHHDQQIAQDAAAGCVDGHVGVHGVAQQQ